MKLEAKCVHFVFYRYRHKDGPERGRDREFERESRDRGREYGAQRDERGFGRDAPYRDREYQYFDDYDREGRGRSKGQWNQIGGRVQSQDNYYPPDMHQQAPYIPSNRYFLSIVMLLFFEIQFLLFLWERLATKRLPFIKLRYRRRLGFINGCYLMQSEEKFIWQSWCFFI